METTISLDTAIDFSKIVVPLYENRYGSCEHSEHYNYLILNEEAVNEFVYPGKNIASFESHYRDCIVMWSHGLPFAYMKRKSSGDPTILFLTDACNESGTVIVPKGTMGNTTIEMTERILSFDTGSFSRYDLEDSEELPFKVRRKLMPLYLKKFLGDDMLLPKFEPLIDTFYNNLLNDY